MQTVERIHDIYRPAAERVRDFAEVERSLSEADLTAQATRCMACGIPFCLGAGCPLGNVVPETSAYVRAGKWREAWEILAATSPLTEFTSRVCPALCENACVNNLATDSPVMIRQLEKIIIETAFARGYVRPVVPAVRSGKQIAVIGSGPAGLLAAELLNRAGHTVSVFEKNASPGGLLRYGIPDFKLEKALIDRRVRVMEAGGVKFRCGTEIGKDIAADYLAKTFDAVVIAIGTPAARDLNVPGRELRGIHLALEYLQGENRAVSGESAAAPINAKGKRVLVIGGGDTGSDCVGTALRQQASSVTQIDIIPAPPATRSAATPWPDWPYQLTTSSSQKEGGERLWNRLTKKFTGKSGTVSGAEIAEVKWEFVNGRPAKFAEVTGSGQPFKTDLVFIAMGFTGVPADSAIAKELALTVTPRGQLVGDPARHIFTVGDARTGQSLVVRAMADAGQIVAAVNARLAR
ncbi:MAG: glutamate synthase subunit beta [Verrucomicrobiales bacterium]|jgi:glutamate synthase (NADPH/NADH) small chain|nr:glutamate synthase subunit beta [Verrucomicrobiales bacterium]